MLKPTSSGSRKRVSTATTPGWTIEKTDEKCHRITWVLPSVLKSPSLLLITDAHWDSAECNRDLLKEHLDRALETNTPVILPGDLFDVMQGRWDPRASQDALREEHRGGKYFDSVISTAVEWFRPYAKIIALVGKGNHETAISKRHDTSLISRFVEGLKAHGSPVVEGGYWGFIALHFTDTSKHTNTLTLHYHHGYGGGGEVTRGFIDHSRTRGMYWADIFVSGHVHRRNLDHNVVLSTDAHGHLRKVNQLFLRCSTYKDETDGWHAEKGRAARPLGGWLVKFHLKRQHGGQALVVTPEAVDP